MSVTLNSKWITLSKIKRIYLAAPIFAFVLSITLQVNANPQICSYDTYKWNTVVKKAVEFRRVTKRYSEVSSSERDSVTGCTLCEQDQVEIKLAGIASFRVCRFIASQLNAQLTELLDAGQPIRRIVGYRVGMTRGSVDETGNRTEFSNHSYGIAFDINSEHNGLYDNCVTFNDNCRLIRGGVWDPAVNQFSLARDGMIVNAMESIGFKWGGSIEGMQKDFMHFSLTGY